MTIWEVSGRFIPEDVKFSNYLITSTTDCIKDEYGEEVDLPMGLTDDDIFYYGMEVPLEMGNHEFEITDYEIFYEEKA